MLINFLYDKLHVGCGHTCQIDKKFNYKSFGVYLQCVK